MDDVTKLRILLIREHTGRNLDPEERQELDTLMQKVPGAHLLSQEIRSLPVDELRQLTEKINLDTALQNVYDRAAIIGKKRRSRIYSFSIAAASVLLVCAGAYLYFGTSKRVDQRPDSAGMVAATLQLSNGKEVTLVDSGTQAIQAGPSTIVNTNRIITLDTSTFSASGRWTRLTVPGKLDFQLRLPDGTRIFLNSESALRLNMNGHREVHLDQGEAYFEVAKNERHPFVVHTPRGDIRVLGTSFNVNTYNKEKLVTSLITGKIFIKAGIDSLILSPGKEAVIRGGEQILQQSFDKAEVIGWVEGVQYFRQTPLQDIAQTITRWYGTEVIMDNSKVAELPVTAILRKKEPLQNFIDNMNLLGSVKLDWDPQGRLRCQLAAP